MKKRDGGHEKFFVDAILGHFKHDNPKIFNENGEVLGELNVQQLAEEAIRNAWRIYKDSLVPALKVAEWILNQYGREQTLRILAQEPLAKWHRLKRILS